MDLARISELLRPFLQPAVLSESQLIYISTYIDILLRWNARINLTSIREPEEIVTRHFGESLFAARHLYPSPADDGATGALARPAGSAWGQPPSAVPAAQSQALVADDHRPAANGGILDLLDLGSGAGFPGLPIKLWSPNLRVTLIESNRKKATFLREVIRSLTLTDIDVFPGRGQDFPGHAHTVTLRAVERFDTALPLAVGLLGPGGRLGLLIGLPQLDLARQLTPAFHWDDPIPIPLSSSRILLMGKLS